MGPLTRAAQAYLAGDPARFHVPGHKGRPLPGLGWEQVTPWDLTECAGMDSLFAAEGPIRETEQAYARLYAAADSLLSAGGSTLCIQAMLALALAPGEALLIDRGAHRAAVNAMALLDLHPHWLLPPAEETTGLPGVPSPAQIADALGKNSGVKAVYLTSPTYFGKLCDISRISAICRDFQVPLLVDSAHGAHLAFWEGAPHPMAQGASLCCDSLHKTLPVLTGGALLQIGDPTYAPGAREKLALFGSTSPSYLVMLSADSALDYLAGPFPRELAAAGGAVARLAALAGKRGFLLPRSDLSDPLRLVLGGAPLGYGGRELASFLRGRGIEPELVGERFCVLMATAANTPGDFARLEQALGELPSRAPLPPRPTPLFALPEQALPLRAAAFAPAESIPVEQAAGRVVAGLVAPCPPGIALAVPGERLDAQTAALLKICGISRVSVVK